MLDFSQLPLLNAWLEESIPVLIVEPSADEVRFDASLRGVLRACSCPARPQELTHTRHTTLTRREALLYPVDLCFQHPDSLVTHNAPGLKIDDRQYLKSIFEVAHDLDVNPRLVGFRPLRTLVRTLERIKDPASGSRLAPLVPQLEQLLSRVRADRDEWVRTDGFTTLVQLSRLRALRRTSVALDYAFGDTYSSFPKVDRARIAQRSAHLLDTPTGASVCHDEEMLFDRIINDSTPLPTGHILYLGLLEELVDNEVLHLALMQYRLKPDVYLFPRAFAPLIRQSVYTTPSHLTSYLVRDKDQPLVADALTLISDQMTFPKALLAVKRL